MLVLEATKQLQHQLLDVHFSVAVFSRGKFNHDLLLVLEVIFLSISVFLSALCHAVLKSDLYLV